MGKGSGGGEVRQTGSSRDSGVSNNGIGPKDPGSPRVRWYSNGSVGPPRPHPPKHHQGIMV